MQILRRVVAQVRLQCYRGERSIVNRQSRDFSSSPTNRKSIVNRQSRDFSSSPTYNNMSKAEKAVKVLRASYGVYVFYKAVDICQTLTEIDAAKVRAVKLGKKVGIITEINFLEPNKVTTWDYDVPDREPNV